MKKWNLKQTTLDRLHLALLGSFPMIFWQSLITANFYYIYSEINKFNSNLDVWGDSNFTPCWFCLNNSGTVKAVTLAFFSIQYLFIRDIPAKFDVHKFPRSPDIMQNSDGWISDFWISGQSLTNENCHNLKSSNDIDMKLGPVSKLGKRNMLT